MNKFTIQFFKDDILVLEEVVYTESWLRAFSIAMAYTSRRCNYELSEMTLKITPI